MSDMPIGLRLARNADFVALAIAVLVFVVAGLIDRDAAVGASVLAVVVFTAYFIQLFISNTFGEDAP